MNAKAIALNIELNEAASSTLKERKQRKFEELRARKMAEDEARKRDRSPINT